MNKYYRYRIKHKINKLFLMLKRQWGTSNCVVLGQFTKHLVLNFYPDWTIYLAGLFSAC